MLVLLFQVLAISTTVFGVPTPGPNTDKDVLVRNDLSEALTSGTFVEDPENSSDTLRW